MGTRISLYVAFSTLALMAVSVRADARAGKIEYHSSVCQKISGGLLYDPLGITAAKDSAIVCPLENITFANDTANTRVSFKVRYQYQVTKCDLRSQGTTFVSIPAQNDPNGNTAASGDAVVPLPTMNDPAPTSLHLYCDLPSGGYLGTIQVTTAPP